LSHDYSGPCGGLCPSISRNIAFSNLLHQSATELEGISLNGDGVRKLAKELQIGPAAPLEDPLPASP
jgi:hypothetical protein